MDTKGWGELEKDVRGSLDWKIEMVDGMAQWLERARLIKGVLDSAFDQNATFILNRDAIAILRNFFEDAMKHFERVRVLFTNDVLDHALLRLKGEIRQ